MKIVDIKYSPILKTTLSELKGYRYLSPEIKKSILPVFELTKGRTSKNDRVGNISKQIDKLFDITENNEFILDLTTEVALSNAQISKMLGHSDGYNSWCSFIKGIHKDYNDNLIPVIHFDDTALTEDNDKQVEELRKLSKLLAFRLDGFDISILKKFSNLKKTQDIIYILDLSYIPYDGYILSDEDKSTKNTLINDINTLIKDYIPYKLFISTSSFPRSAIEVGDNYNGESQLYEISLYNELKNHVEDKSKVFYGDYGCVHPNHIQQAGTRGWHPRIDYPLDDKWFYHREILDRINSTYTAGYTNVARKVVDDSLYKQISCWGDDEITSAAQGNPNGKSPMHWIAVRTNIHMTRQCQRLYLES